MFSHPVKHDPRLENNYRYDNLTVSYYPVLFINLSLFDIHQENARFYVFQHNFYC